jgi:CelD/BcsL family acetyltransferase involved in cellulose biosynthesis
MYCLVRQAVTSTKMTHPRPRPTVYTFNPLTDSRWGQFVETQPLASVFHTRGWLDAIRRTYSYEPVVYTTSPPDEPLENGVLLCCVRSWLTGRRMVGVPFADHCEPLVDGPLARDAIFSALQQAVEGGAWKYVEFRSLRPDFFAVPGLRPLDSFCFHAVDLRPPLDALFAALHKDSIRRKLRRAEREGLRYETGSSSTLLDHFYGLLVATRRRHGLPPQPAEWFQNLFACLGDRIAMHFAFRGEQPIGAIITLRHAGTLVYKYGASDARFHNLGVMPMLFWNTMMQAKERGLHDFDLGRSHTNNTGLIAFKDHLGAARSMAAYAQYAVSRQPAADDGYAMRLARLAFASMPTRLLIAAGRLLYKHIG